MANLTSSTGSLVKSWGYPLAIFNGLGISLLNFNDGQSLYNQTLTVSLVNVTARPYVWWTEFTVHFTEQWRTARIRTQFQLVLGIAFPVLPEA